MTSRIEGEGKRRRETAAARFAAIALVLSVAAALAPAPASAAEQPFEIVLQVYEGPHDKTGQGWKKKEVRLVPGSEEAREFVENNRRSNPGLVLAFEELTKEGPFLNHVRWLHSLDGKTPKLYLVDDTQKFVDRDGDGAADTDEKAEDERGVWPHRRGNSIYISQSYLGTYPSTDTVHELIGHEYSHSQDHTGRGSGDYGPDDSHFADEILYRHGGGWKFWQRGGYSERAAFAEGWANYTPIIFNPKERDHVVSSVEDLRRETSKGKYEIKSWEDASYEELIAVEHINSLILYDIDRYIPNGRDKIVDAFRDTNRSGRTLRDVLEHLIRENPADAFAIAAIFDAYTGFKAPDKVLDELLGKDLARIYREEHRDKLKGRNAGGGVTGAEQVGAYAAANLREESVEAGIAAIDARLRELEGWNLSPWDILGGPGSILLRRWQQDRESARLRAERQALQAELERIRQARATGLGSALRERLTLLLPGAARRSKPRSSPATSTTSGPSARPARSLEGAPVDWVR